VGCDPLAQDLAPPVLETPWPLSTCQEVGYSIWVASTCCPRGKWALKPPGGTLGVCVGVPGFVYTWMQAVRGGGDILLYAVPDKAEQLLSQQRQPGTA